VPTMKPRGEDKLLELFLSVYEGRGWAGELSRVEYPERLQDRGVELIATQLATGRTLAIEHTISSRSSERRRTFTRTFRSWRGSYVPTNR
jgi:hypothetical protein